MKKVERGMFQFQTRPTDFPNNFCRTSGLKELLSGPALWWPTYQPRWRRRLVTHGGETLGQREALCLQPPSTGLSNPSLKASSIVLKIDTVLAGQPHEMEMEEEEARGGANEPDFIYS